jgi:hypothetical protein
MLIFSTTLVGQVTLIGSVTDSISGEPLIGAIVTMSVFEGSAVLAYTLTDAEGKFEAKHLSSVTAGVYTLSAQYLGYRDYRIDIVISDSTNVVVNLPPILLSPKSVSLEEVVVKSRPPIVIKQDTIIYDLPHWTEAHDETLEAVLQKIPGIRISADGSITVEGQLVQKVVINGEEVSDQGAALLTRSIDPDKVAKVEVRFKERDAKLRESLLDNGSFVVLDIKLDDDAEQSTFGRLQSSIGIDSVPRAGAYANGFMLRDKLKVHLFAQIDRFGMEHIPLSSIRNLGSEAFAKMMRLPSSFREARQGEGYQLETYNFDNFFVRDDNAIVGLTTRVDLSPRTTLFLGSYNARGREGYRTTTEQRTTFGETRVFQTDDRLKDLSSFNKIDYRFDSEYTKIDIEGNYVFTTRSQLNKINIGPKFRAEERSFGDTLEQNHVYLSGRWEWAPSAKGGAQLLTGFSNGRNDNLRGLIVDSTAYSTFFGDARPSRLQLVEAKERQVFVEVNYRHNVSEQTAFLIGGRYSNTKLWQERNSSSPRLVQVTEDVQEQRSGPHIRTLLDFEKVNVTADATIAYRFLHYPSSLAARPAEQARSTELLANVVWNPKSPFRVSFDHSNIVSPFRMRSLFPGAELVNFQSVFLVEDVRMSPQRQQQSLLVGSYFVNNGLSVDLAAFQTVSRQTNRSSFDPSGLIVVGYDELPERFNALSLAIMHPIGNGKWRLRADPEAIFVSTENVLMERVYTNRIRDYRLALTIESTPALESFGTTAQIKFVHINYLNDLIAQPTLQRMLWLNWDVQKTLLPDRLFMSFDTRYVRFLQDRGSSNWLLNCELRYMLNSINVKVVAQNVFNTQDFIRNEQDVLLASTVRSSLFGRFVKVAVDRTF